jgi:DNA-binding response OmpR family regulator
MLDAPESCRVLLVEDDPDARDVIERYSAARGTRCARPRRSARLEVARPSHVLLDLMLPDCGDELLRALRQGRVRVRVALLTAAGWDSRAVGRCAALEPRRDRSRSS